MVEHKFTCPKCENHEMEEGQVDVVVTSPINAVVERHDGSVAIDYGKQTNEGGHVGNYQCRTCGYIIVDDSPENEDKTQDGLDEHSLVMALKELNAPPQKGDLVSADELIQRISDQYETLSGHELAEEWNKLCPANEVMYEGDSLFWVK